MQAYTHTRRGKATEVINKYEYDMNMDTSHTKTQMLTLIDHQQAHPYIVTASITQI